MKEFVIGLLVLMCLGVLSVLAALLFPLIIVLSVFLRGLIYAAFLIFAVWLVGKVTVLSYQYLKRDRSVEMIDEDEYRHRGDSRRDT